jgi:FADH2-dependent halogenase
LAFDKGMSQALYDALIIGGGPGGSTAATFLARAGKRVLLLEKEIFPRFHIGESLLPYNHRIFEEMGVLPAIQAAGFTNKHGAQFHLGNSSKSLKLTFRNGRFTREPRAFQVERSQFDQLLLQHARSCGADAREGWIVTASAPHGDHVSVQARHDGESTEFHGRFLLDASGRVNFTGNQEGIRVVHPNLKKLAIFGHFDGVKTDDGEKAGDIHIVRLSNKWFWLIPLSPSKVSVGCVMDQHEFAEAKVGPADVFERIWRSSAEMRDRMKDSRAVTPLQTTTDFSYYNRRLVGPRLLRIGDAAGFMDPIFSAGVFLAMHSGKLAANVVIKTLEAGDDGAARLEAYERRVFRAMEYYWELVEEFYTDAFMDLFMQPRPKFSLPDAVVAILAGELEGGWRLTWRRRVFFWLVKLQRRWPIVPRLSMSESATPAVRPPSVEVGSLAPH